MATIEAIKRKNKKYYQRHKEERLAYGRQYYQEHREEQLAYQNRYNQENKERRRAQSRIRLQELKRQVISFYSNGKNICATCGFNDIRALSIDHKAGQGHQHRKQIKSAFYQWLKDHNFPSGFQVLCMNCQFIKKFEKGETR